MTSWTCLPDPLRPEDTDAEPEVPEPTPTRPGWLVPLIVIAVLVAAVAWRFRP